MSSSAIHVDAALSAGRRAFWTGPRVLLLCFLLSLPLVNPIVHGDGVGYYAYARAVLIQHNLNFEEDWRHGNLGFAQARVSSNGQLYPGEYTETGHVGNLFSIGPAMLWLPFLAVAHALVLAGNALGANLPADGFSFPYLLAMALGSAIYGFLGLLLSFSLARKYVGEKWALLATLGIWLCSSLPVYMYFNPAWSHAHSAFVAALFLWYWDHTRTNRGTGQWLLLGLVGGLMIDVYYPNGVLLVIPLLESAQAYISFWPELARAGRKLFLQNVVFLLAVFVATLPIYITRKIIFGGYLRLGSYSLLPWDWSAPHWRSVLFSPDHGLLSWTPLLGFALFGLFLAPRPARTVALYFAVAAGAFYYVISSYPYWDGIASFGNRFFISLTPLFIFGLAVLLFRVGQLFSSPRMAAAVLSTTLAAFALWNWGFIFQWGAHLVPVRGAISWSEMAHNQFHVVPRKIAEDTRAYVFRRHSLMRSIEERDIEQQKRAQPQLPR